MHAFNEHLVLKYHRIRLNKGFTYHVNSCLHLVGRKTLLDFSPRWTGAIYRHIKPKQTFWFYSSCFCIWGVYRLSRRDVKSAVCVKAELEAIPLRWVLESKAVLDSCAYNSVLTITVDDQEKRSPQVYMFQCEETGVSPTFEPHLG